MDEKVVITINGKRKTVSKMEAALHPASQPGRRRRRQGDQADDGLLMPDAERARPAASGAERRSAARNETGASCAAARGARTRDGEIRRWRRGLIPPRCSRP